MTAVADVIARFVLALDDRDWSAVTGHQADTVARDYSSLTGAAPDDIAGSELVAEWREVLGGLDAHQHVLGLPVIEVPDDVDGRAGRARAAAHVVATHVLDGDPASPWVVGGTYRFGLGRVGDRWRITAIRLDTRWETGDRSLLERATARHRVTG